MDDAMYDMQTGSQNDGAGHEPVKRKPVRPAELRLDDSKENLGLERVDYGYCFASMFVRQVRQCFSVVWADGFPRCRHRFPVM